MAVSRERVIQNAEKYVSRGKIEPAIKEYRKLLAENPNDISTLNRVGDLYARINRNSEAIDLFTQIAQQYAEDGFFVKSIAIYKKIIKIDPTLLEVYEQLADLYHRQGLVNEARTQYQVLADYYLKHDRMAQAISIYRRMAELEPDDPSHHVKLAELYQQEGAISDAMGEYRAIAGLMLDHDRGIEAARVYERALDVSSEDLGFITDAVLKLKERGHVAAAASFLALAVERNPQAQRVANLAGLRDRPAPIENVGDTGDDADTQAAAPVAVDEPSAEPAEELAEGAPEVEASWGEVAVDDPSTVDVSEVLSSVEDAVSDPSPSGSPATGFELEDLEPQVFELDLEDDTSSSLVTPPADMLQDRDRRGAAWVDPESPASPPSRGPSEVGDAGDTGGDEPVRSATGTFELDLDVLEAQDGGPGEPEVFDAPEIDHDLLERTAAEVHAGSDDEVEDLLTEAEVLARYGIEEKALERLAELLQREPRNLEGYALMVGIHLDAGRNERVVAVAGRMAEIAGEMGDETVWPELRERLVDSGYTIHEDGLVRIEPPAGREETAEIVLEGVEVEGVEVASAEIAGAAEIDISSGAGAVAGLGALPSIDEEDLDLDLDGDLMVDPADSAVVQAVSEPEVEELPPVEEPETEEKPPPVEEPPADEEPPPVEEPPADEEPPAPIEEPPKKRRDVDSILAQLSGQFLGRRKKRPEPEPPVLVEPVEPVEPTEPPEPAEPVVEAPAPPVAAQAPSPAPGGRVDPLRALGDSLRAEIDETARAAAAADSSAGSAGSVSPPSLDDTGVSWLDEMAAAPPAAADAFADDADFFDLGAELEQELSAEESLDEDLVVLDSGEQSLEEIVEGFKRGVSENLSPEDFDTHYNLGIAYREMGLLDEAIGEFQLAAREPDYLVSCASMLGLCFTEKGLPELAVKWYLRGLDAPGVSEDDRAGLLYDLGEAQVAAGDRMAAYHTFVDLYGINTNYRDVVARLTELEPVR